MRAIFVAIALCVLPGWASAQDAPITFTLPEVAPAAPSANAAWMAEDAEATRFADSEDAGPKFKSGESVTVLYTEGERVRVRKGDRYGWVAATALTREAPATAMPSTAPTMIPTGPDGEFDLERLKALLEDTKPL